MSLKIIFAGTPAFAVPTLESLIAAGFDVCAVLTQPDRPAGRGRHLHASAVKDCALAHQLPIYQPQHLRDADVQQTLHDLNADVMVVVAYGLLLPKAVLNMPRLGCINVHASLLPRWRGAAPIHYALLEGDALTGITIMRMDEGLDTGPMLAQTDVAIAEHDTTATMTEILSRKGAELLVETLRHMEGGDVSAVPQDNTQATHAPKIQKQQASIDWQRSAAAIARQVRVFDPWPGAFTQNDRFDFIKIWRAEALEDMHSAIPGEIVAVDNIAFDIATGKGVLRVHEVQRPGGRRVAAADFLHAHNADIKPGVRFG